MSVNKFDRRAQSIPMRIVELMETIEERSPGLLRGERNATTMEQQMRMARANPILTHYARLISRRSWSLRRATELAIHDLKGQSL